jgi:tight adherence protein B
MNQNLILFFVFCAVLTFVLGIYIIIRDWVVYRGRIRSRVAKVNSGPIVSEAELLDIRQDRSLTRDAGYAIPLVALNKLIVQSGTTWGLRGVILLAISCTTAAYIILGLAGLDLLFRLPASIASGLGAPVIILRAMREAHQRRFEEQLPEAIDTIVRGLKAGHTTPTAIATVSRHFPNPIGAEFRITASEMAYGLDLEASIGNLYARVGQDDLKTLSVAMTVQSKTGGNLTEILSTISAVIRERQKLRRKARALSSEARVSAYIMSVLPFFVLGMLWLISPGYYGDIWNNPVTKPILVGALFWMLLGDYIMYRMGRIRV